MGRKRYVVVVGNQFLSRTNPVTLAPRFEEALLFSHKQATDRSEALGARVAEVRLGGVFYTDGRP